MTRSTSSPAGWPPTSTATSPRFFLQFVRGQFVVLLGDPHGRKPSPRPIPQGQLNKITVDPVLKCWQPPQQSSNGFLQSSCGCHLGAGFNWVMCIRTANGFSRR